MAHRIGKIRKAEDRIQSALLAARDRIVGEVERAIDRGEATLQAVFDDRYVPIPDTNPQQFETAGLALFDRLFPAAINEVLGVDRDVLFRIATDTNGWLPVHNPQYSKPQGSDPVWNAANCRNRRMFEDRTAIAAARNNAQQIFVQTYERDIGDRKVLMKDVSSPIRIKGKHWGTLRVGLKFE